MVPKSQRVPWLQWQSRQVLWFSSTILHTPVSLHTAGPSCAFSSTFCAPTAFTQNTPKLCVCRDARSESNLLLNPPKAPLCACARPLDSFQMSWALRDGEKVPMALFWHPAILLFMCWLFICKCNAELAPKREFKSAMETFLLKWACRQRQTKETLWSPLINSIMSSTRLQ